MSRMKVLSDKEIQTIHESTLDLLQEVGVKVETQQARELLKLHGAIEDSNDSKNKSIFIKFPRELIKEQLKKVPNSFTLWGSDGSYKVKIDTETTRYATVGTPIKIYDKSNKKGVRKSLLQDTIKQIRIVDSLKNIIASHVDVWPNDVPYTELHCHTIREWARNSYKPYGLGCYGQVASQDMMDLTSIIVGGEEELKHHPRLIGFFNPTSPLYLTRIMLNGLFVFARYNQPIIIAPAVSAGATAPVTLAGVLVQSNMEILSTIVLTQLINPGTPLFYSTMSAPMDPVTGNVAWGSIETGLITAGMAQMARHYGIPSRGPGAVTESKCFDIQNGQERFMTLFCSAQAGINYITCAGTYESSLSEAFELLVVDDELIDIVNRGLQGVRIEEDNLALEQIKEVALSGKNFLSLRHTAKNTRKELYVPFLSDRQKRGKWLKDGASDIMDRAKERVEQILQSQKGPGLSPEIERKIDDFIKKVAKRSMEDYRTAEGFDDSTTKESIDLPGN